MTTLYGCHTDGDNWRITKFIDGNPEASYLTSPAECQCPAGERATCRHRQMLPIFIARDLVDQPWFLDWDHGGRIVDFQGFAYLPPTQPHSTEASASDFDSEDGGSNPSAAAKGFAKNDLIDEAIVTTTSTKPSQTKFVRRI